MSPAERHHYQMWYGFDPDLRRQLDSIREMVARRYQTPTREWPLIFVDEHGELLVVREWPDGGITAYATTPSANTREEGGETAR